MKATLTPHRDQRCAPDSVGTHATLKRRISETNRASIAKTRWAAYAAAGAATVVVGTNSAEAAIHYSGRLHVPFPPDQFLQRTFSLDSQGDRLEFVHKSFASGFAGFNVLSGTTNGYVGFRGRGVFSVSKLSFGQNISGGTFIFDATSYPGVMAVSGRGQWLSSGDGFIGFRFKTDAGIQYGWARVKMGGNKKNNSFKVLDWAYADAGEPIFAGQRSSDEQAPDQTVEQNSLGWLAVGAAGLVGWRKNRSRTARPN